MTPCQTKRYALTLGYKETYPDEYCREYGCPYDHGYIKVIYRFFPDIVKAVHIFHRYYHGTLEETIEYSIFRYSPDKYTFLGERFIYAKETNNIN